MAHHIRYVIDVIIPDEEFDSNIVQNIGAAYSEIFANDFDSGITATVTLAD